MVGRLVVRSGDVFKLGDEINLSLCNFSPCLSLGFWSYIDVVGWCLPLDTFNNRILKDIDRHRGRASSGNAPFPLTITSQFSPTYCNLLQQQLYSACQAYPFVKAAPKRGESLSCSCLLHVKKVFVLQNVFYVACPRMLLFIIPIGSIS